MPNVKYNGSQAFIEQTGGGITYGRDGTASLTKIWRGPIHKLAGFRNSISTIWAIPNAGTLRLTAPPNEFYEGAYARVVATYGGSADEVTASFPNDIDDDTQEVPTVALSLDFQISSAVIEVSNDLFKGEVRVDYRTPVNTVNYTRSSKPTNVSGRARSGIGSEADPKIISAIKADVIYDLRTQQTYDPAESMVKLLRTDFADQWKIEDAAVAFRRSSNGQVWRCSETWTKLIMQAGSDEDVSG